MEYSVVYGKNVPTQVFLSADARATPRCLQPFLPPQATSLYFNGPMTLLSARRVTGRVWTLTGYSEYPASASYLQLIAI